MYLDDEGRRRYVHTDTGDEKFYAHLKPGLQLEEGNWSEDYNYSPSGQSSIRDEAYRNWYETTHPQPYSLDQARQYWVNRRRQLHRCQANLPQSYEAFLRANQPAEGHPAVQITHDPSPSRAGYTKIGRQRGRHRQLPHPNGIIGQVAPHRCH